MRRPDFNFFFSFFLFSSKSLPFTELPLVFSEVPESALVALGSLPLIFTNCQFFFVLPDELCSPIIIASSGTSEKLDKSIHNCGFYLSLVDIHLTLCSSFIPCSNGPLPANIEVHFFLISSGQLIY
jgi:hypothetical protein